jgi:hypothetical protein
MIDPVVSLTSGKRPPRASSEGHSVEAASRRHHRNRKGNPMDETVKILLSVGLGAVLGEGLPS